MMDAGAIATRAALWWLLFPAIGLPVSLLMARRGDRGFLERIFVWLVIIPVFLGVAFLGRWPLAALLSLAGLAALREVARLESAPGPRGLPLVVGALLAVGGPLAAAGAWPGHDAAAAVWLVAPVIYFLAPRRTAGARIVAAGAYLGAGLAAWPLLLALPVGYRFVLIAFSVVTVADILAFVAGRLKPRVYIFPRLSPRKTLLGTLGGAAAAVAVGFILWYAVPELSAAGVAGGALLLAAAGVAGDLLASGIKRRHGAKDFGGALGRMGGVLDRLDSLLGAGWVYLLYLRISLGA
jgi:phosphatidate cytidylyltransferase